MRVFAFDHRMQLGSMAKDAGADPARIGAFKQLCLKAAPAGRRHGRASAYCATAGSGAMRYTPAAGTGLWIGRPVELPGSRPLDIEPELGPDLGGLAEWPLDHVVKALCFYHPDDDPAVEGAAGGDRVAPLRGGAPQPARIPAGDDPVKGQAPVDDETTATVICRFYDIGVYPDWWKLEPMKTDAAWKNACDAIEPRDPAYARHRGAGPRRIGRPSCSKASQLPPHIRW